MSSKKSRSECSICLGEHDEQIHAATVRVHTWWREVLRTRLCYPENVAQFDPAAL
jgi:hypothetical protein